MDLVVNVCWWGERDSSIILAKSIEVLPKFWQAKLLKETDGETIDVTMDSYQDIEMRNELHVDEVWYVYHHSFRVGMMTHQIACWRAPPQTQCRGDLFIHVKSWPAVYRLMRRVPFILHRYDSQSFLRIGVLPSPCGSSRIPTSNTRRCCIQDFKFCSG